MPALEPRLRTISTDLCRALTAVLTEALVKSGQTNRLRPVSLTNCLGLNKSLASRLARSLRETDELKALHGIPTPQGLQLVERATRSNGASEASLKDLVSATEAYGQMLAEFSGGRTGLEAVLSGLLPEQRAQAQRDARRSVFRGMTTLEGTQTTTAYNAVYLFPSADDEARLDSIILAVREGVRRLRAHQQIPLFTAAAGGSNGDWRQGRQTLGGAHADEDGNPQDLRPFLLETLCSQPTPALDFVRVGSSTVVKIASEALEANECATIGFGWRMAGHFVRYRKSDTDYAHLVFGCSKPTETMVIDLFLHHEIALQEDIIVSMSRDRTPDYAAVSGPPVADDPARIAAPPVVRLQDCVRGLATQDVLGCQGISDTVSAETGIDLADFTAYRTRVEYPMATEEVSLWWKPPGMD